MSAEIDALELAVTKVQTVKGSVVTLLQGLAARVRAIAGDAAKAGALATELDTMANDFAQAVVDNTVP
jgi:hypothetical protein